MDRTDLKKGLLISGIILFASLTRLVDHPMNFTSVTAIALFGAAYFSNTWIRFILPLSILVFSDFILELKTGWGFHSGTPLVYFSFMLIILMGSFLLKKPTWLNIGISAFAGSVLFFLVTNFAFFYPVSATPDPLNGYYPHNLTGIVASYKAGLPFFRNMLIGDLIYSALFFGLAKLVFKWNEGAFGVKRTGAN